VVLRIQTQTISGFGFHTVGDTGQTGGHTNSEVLELDIPVDIHVDIPMYIPVFIPIVKCSYCQLVIG